MRSRNNIPTSVLPDEPQKRLAGRDADSGVPQLQERELDGNDRVCIRQGSRPLSWLVGRVGTVVEVFRLPYQSCLVRIDGGPNRQREWFFYRDEVTIRDT